MVGVDPDAPAPQALPAERLADDRAALVARSQDPRLAAALAAIDDANGADPTIVPVGDGRAPKELVHAQLMTAWVLSLDPQATDLQVLAGRAYHLRRWSIPRTEFPHGRAGYLRWRTTLKKQHADEVATILQPCGYGADEIERVQGIIRKEGLNRDPAVQTHEDAICLVFLQTGQLSELIAQLDEDHMVEIVRKTLRKMSPAGVATALTLPLTEHELQIVGRATAESA